MYLKTKVNEGLRLEAASARPSSLKHWWKASEATAATILVDAVSGCNINISGVTAANGVISAIGNRTPISSINAGTLTDPGTATFMFILKATTNTLGVCALGDTVGKIQISGVTIGGSRIVGAGGTSSTDGVPTENHTYALIYNGTNNALYQDGVIVGTADAATQGSIDIDQVIQWTSLSNLAGMALFIFDGAIPSDFAIASAFMGDSWANNEKVLFPSNVAEWGTWA